MEMKSIQHPVLLGIKTVFLSVLFHGHKRSASRHENLSVTKVFLAKTVISVVVILFSIFCHADPLNSWTQANSLFGASAIAYGNGMFVGVSHENYLTSLDGANWTAYTTTLSLNTTYGGGGIAYGAGAFLAFGQIVNPPGGYGILKSTDGLTWAKIYTSSNHLSAAAYGNNTWVFINTGEIVTASVTSSNWNWTEFYSPPFIPYSITYANGKFVIPDHNYIVSSTDGITWQYESPAPNSGYSFSVQGIIFGNGRYVYSATSNYYSTSWTYTPEAYVSSNLVQWTQNTIAPSSTNFQISTIAFGGNQFIQANSTNGSGSVCSIRTSTDGNVWTNRGTINAPLKTFAYGQGTFVASDGDVIYQSGVFTTESNSSSTTLAISTYPGVTINGTAGAVYQIQCTTNANSTNWLVLTNITLPYSPYLWVDTSSTINGRRFYRSVQLQ
jgi:hypothetical protein